MSPLRHVPILFLLAKIGGNPSDFVDFYYFIPYCVVFILYNGFM